MQEGEEREDMWEQLGETSSGIVLHVVIKEKKKVG